MQSATSCQHSPNSVRASNSPLVFINMNLHPLTVQSLSSLHRLMDVKQGLNKESRTVLYLVFEYLDTDLKKFIRSFRQPGHNILQETVKSLMYQLCKGMAFCHGHGTPFGNRPFISSFHFKNAGVRAS
ncbi:unnamed protein product [Brassica oleracea var. botrytis]